MSLAWVLHYHISSQTSVCVPTSCDTKYILKVLKKKGYKATGLLFRFIQAAEQNTSLKSQLMQNLYTHIFT